MVKINNLQALRAFAALNVTLFHTLATSDAYGYQLNLFSPLLGWGGNGVDIFFVLSGFIMVYILNNKKVSPKDFFIERLLRVAPLYWILTGTFLMLVLAVPSAFRSESPSIIPHALASIFFISQAWLGQLPLLFDGWSLEYEMLFYVLLTIGLFFPKRYQAYVFASAGIIFSALVFKIDPIVYEFIFGMVVGYLFCYLKGRIPFAWPFFILGAVLFFSTLVHNPLLDWTESRIIRAGIPSLFIVYGLIGVKQIHSGLLTLLGDASYSIYLIQVFTIPAFYKLVTYLRLPGAQADVLALICLGLTASAGLISYWVLERHLNKTLRNS